MFSLVPYTITDFLSKILHDELEASLRQISDELADTKEDLDKQKVLNDRLESDLLQMEQHQPNGTRVQSPDNASEDQDPLTSLNLGTKKTVRLRDMFWDNSHMCTPGAC